MCVLRTRSPFQIGKICCPDFILMDFMMKKQKKDNFKNLHFFRQEIRLKLDSALICDYLNFLTRYGSQMLHGDFFCQNTISKMVRHAKMGQKLWILAIVLTKLSLNPLWLVSAGLAAKRDLVSRRLLLLGNTKSNYSENL